MLPINQRKEYLSLYKKLSQSKGGELLSKRYINSNTKLQFKCALGHRWKTYPYNVKAGHWCSKCARVRIGKYRRDPISLFQKLITSKGGLLLDEKFVRQARRLYVQCSEGHTWWKHASKIKSGEWCRRCSYATIGSKIRKYSIQDFQKYAKSKGGKCLSKEYTNSLTRLQFECRKGHQWDTNGAIVRNNHWCKKCSSKRAANRLRDSIETFQVIASEKGGRCLSRKYENQTSVLKFICVNGHRFSAKAAFIKRKGWCQECAKWAAAAKRRTPISVFLKLAEKKGGRCLTNNYINQKSKLLFECAEGHKWWALGGTIKGGGWCPFCANTYPANTPDTQKLRLDNIIDAAKAKGGKCLSNKYINSKSKLQFECLEGHRWWTIPGLVIKGNWCKKCSVKRTADKQRDNLDVFVNIIESRGGKCLSDEYINVKHHLLVECAKGHQWLALPQNIKKGRWCRKCLGTAPWSIEDIKRLAEKNGGKCLSKVYKNDMTNIIWQCSEGHIWNATPNNIKRGKWCPECSQGFGERVCRLYFQKLFNTEFPRVRPDWLRSKRNFRLELDGYSKKLKLAFEHQGEQHYREVDFFVKAPRYDMDKRRLCRKHGVALIEIPEVPSLTRLKDLKEYIINSCKVKGVSLPRNIEKKQITPYEIFTYTRNQEKKQLIEQCQALVATKGGQFLETYLLQSNQMKIRMLCDKGHEWAASPARLLEGQWCSYCKRAGKLQIQKERSTTRKQKQRLWGAGVTRYSIEDMRSLANRKKGNCLSDRYINYTTKLVWNCQYGHQWEAPPGRILQGGWCPICAGNTKGTIESIIELVKSKAGFCLSKKYISNRSKVGLKCEHGHRFYMAPHALKRGNWCPVCAINGRADKKRKPISFVHDLASKKNGKCLSTKYQHSFEKLLWECNKKHQWYATPNNIRWGKWCPKCAREDLLSLSRSYLESRIAEVIETNNGNVKSFPRKLTRLTSLTWECGKGHVWRSRVSNIIGGSWCARCANSKNWDGRRTTIEDVRSLAASKGGSCLSEKYLTGEKLKFSCKYGHQWSALWSNIKDKGSWCPACARKLVWERRKMNLKIKTEHTI